MCEVEGTLRADNTNLTDHAEHNGLRHRGPKEFHPKDDVRKRYSGGRSRSGCDHPVQPTTHEVEGSEVVK